MATGLAAAAVLVSGCGVAAPRNVASVDGVGVSLKDVNTVARDPLSQLVGPGADEYSLPGDAARNALLFELTRAAWTAEAERWGLDPDSARSEAEKNLEQRIKASPEPVKLSEHMREAYLDVTAAQFVLEKRFKELDPDNEADLRKVYEMSPALWDRTCAWILSVPEGAEAKVERLAARGTAFDKIAKRVEGATVAAQPDQGCLSQASIPVDLRSDLNSLRIDEAKVFETDFSGAPEKYLIKVVSRGRLGFEEASRDLRQIVNALRQSGPQAWISTRLAEASVDPRFASAVTLGSGGEPSLIPPATPLPSRTKSPAPAEADRAGL